MEINSVSFVKSSAHPRECPPMDKPEYAFIGRSNVGKSSLINMVVGRLKMAKISSTPGKTQLINHFLINEHIKKTKDCLLYTSPSPRDQRGSRMPSSA